MLKMESFLIAQDSVNSPGTVLLRKNCSEKRALRLWKKYKKKYTAYKGTYIVVVATKNFRQHFEVKDFADTV